MKTTPSEAPRAMFVAKGKLQFLSAYHSRGALEIVGLDAPLIRNGQNDLIVPGTSLAGALRAWASGVSQSLHVDALFGPRLQSGSQDTAASLLTCYDIVLNGTEMHRDGVGINRFTGTAAENFKFDHTVLAPGASGDVQIICHMPDEDAQDGLPLVKLLSQVLAALRDGHICLGGLTTKGFGRCKVSDITLKRVPSGRAGAIARVAAGSSDVGDDVTLPETGVLKAGHEIIWSVELQQLSPMFSRVAVLDGLVDSVPLVERHHDKAVLVIPGSSIKGILRSEAERIMRTLSKTGEEPAFCGMSLNEQVRVPLVNELFGTGKISSSTSAPNLPDQRGALRCSELYAELGNWSSWVEVFSVIETRVKSEDKKALAKSLGELETALKEASLPAWRVSMHVAIDRWTGGAAKGKLFSSLEPHNTNWQPLRLSIDTRLLGKSAAEAAQILLLLSLQSLTRQHIGLGFGFDRGYGRVQVTKINEEEFSKFRDNTFEKYRGEWQKYLESCLPEEVTPR